MLFVYEKIGEVLCESDEFRYFEHQLLIFGSVLNGLYDKNNSDLDLTIIVHQNAGLNHLKILEKARTCL